MNLPIEGKLGLLIHRSLCKQGRLRCQAVNKGKKPASAHDRRCGFLFILWM